MRIAIYVIAFVVAMGALAASGYAFIFFLIGILPTVVAAFIDKRMSKAASNTIGSFNITGMFPYLLDLWNSGSMANVKAQVMIANINIWFIIYSSAALGWVVIWGFPSMMGNFFIYRSKSRVSGYRKEQARLVEEWSVSTEKSTFKEYTIHNKIIENKDD